jgi:outer membrane protein OmpA-like peptidoglycan-associated protein
LLAFSCFNFMAFCQNAKLEGYVFEEQNRGYLNMARITVVDTISKTVFAELYSNGDGFFSTNVPAGIPLTLRVDKDMFNSFTTSYNLKTGQKENVSVKLMRLPGYIFEITLAERRPNPDAPAQAILHSHVEMYNNTLRQPVLDIVENRSPEFKLNFLKGNHYTILIRKKGYLAKRLEAYVNVNGCILCFDGVGDVRPGVTDNLSNNNQIGVLLANVEMEKADIYKTITIKNIYYELGKANLTKDSYKELDNVASIALNNPEITFEIGSHTDSRGNEQLNLDLSNQRSSAAYSYLIHSKNVPRNQLKFKGYGETILVNQCKDGIICSEEDHSFNRRTELKILSIDSTRVPMPLKQIKTMEEFEKDLFIPAATDTIINLEKKTTEPIIKVDESSNSTKQIYAEKSVNVRIIDSMDSNVILTNTISYRLRAGVFSEKANAQNLLDKLKLLGYPNAIVIQNEDSFMLIADIFTDEQQALKAKIDLKLNDVDAAIDVVNSSK